MKASTVRTEEAFKLLEKEVQASGAQATAMCIFDRVDASSDIDVERVWRALRDSGCGSFGRWNTLRLDEDIYQYHEALRRYLHGLLKAQFLSVHVYLQVAPFEEAWRHAPLPETCQAPGRAGLRVRKRDAVV
jgi:hypothetical protein